jgi:hypothetical protein
MAKSNSLTAIFGKEGVIDNPEVLSSYAKNQSFD